MKRTTLKLPFLILCVTAGLQIMAGCKTDDGAFEWKEKRGKHTLYLRKDKIGHLEPLFLKDISTNDEITRIEDGVFRIKRTCKNISQRDFGQVSLIPGGLVLVPEWFKLAELTGHQIWKEKAKAVWANANQAVADGKTKFHDVIRPAGSQTEAYFQSYWVGKPGQINDWLVLWPSAARLEVLRMIDPKVFSE
ncbi:MAG: hypothetical protein AB2L20_31825 [Mangrovibacterium sp.]